MKRVIAMLLGAALGLAPPLWAAPAPDFDLKTQNGRVTQAGLKGRVIYLDFWASWCAPCRKSFPWMNELQSRYGEQGLTVVAVNLDKDPELVKRFLAEQAPTFTVAYDPSGETAQRFRVQGMPSSYLIDAAGNLVSAHVGFREEDKGRLEESIRALLQAQGGRQ